MADITSSLFPEVGSLFNQQYLGAQKSGQNLASYASGSPLQTLMGVALQGAGQGGYMLGSGVGRALGGTTPEEQQAAKVKSIADQITASGVNLQSAKGMTLLAQELSKQGEYNSAQKAMAAARILEEQEAKGEERKSQLELQKAQTGLATARTAAVGTEKAASTESERLRNLISAGEIKLASGESLTPKEEAQIRFAVGQATKSRLVTDPESGTTTMIPALDIGTAAPNIAKFLGKATTAAAAAPTAGAPQTAIPEAASAAMPTMAAGATQIQTGKGKAPKELDASLVKELGTIDANLSKLSASIQDTEALAPKIANLDVGLVQNFARGAQAWAGVNTEDRLAFDAIRRSVLQQANNLLLMAKGTQTEGDATRALATIADDNTWKNKDALKAAYAGLQKTLKDTQDALKTQRNTVATKGAGGSSSASSSTRNETIISRAMAANKGMSREQVITELKKAGYL